MGFFGETSDFDLKLADDCEVYVSVGQEEVAAAHSRFPCCLSDSLSRIFSFLLMVPVFPLNGGLTHSD